MTGRPMPLQRYKMVIAYRGTAYHGWQFQSPSMTWKGPTPPVDEGIPTVQSHVRKALLRTLKHEVTVVGSGRTDAGVHAKGQVAHFDTHMVQIPCEGIRRSANSKLPDDILIRSVEPVASTFDAIASTVSKRYQYAIWHAYDRPPMLAGLVWHRWKDLDVPAMAAAARQFEGTHDFTTFARPGHGRATAVRTIHRCEVRYRAPRLVIGFEGGGFLWHQIRIMTGTLVEVGMGHRSADSVPAMLAARDRRAAGGTAPPHGLYLQWVKSAEGTVVTGEQATGDDE
jgi:tRNA pseudouridine38-40 synthase